MNEQLYRVLVDIARKERTITYGEIANIIGLDMSNPLHRKEIGDLLGEISRYEVLHGRPMLSAVVIHKENNRPGKGFFQLAQELGIYDGSDDSKFFVEELKKVYQHWSNRFSDGD